MNLLIGLKRESSLPMTEQINLFDGHVPYYKITKPVRLIELFAGIGSQHQALKNLGVKIDRTTIVEWQVNSIQAYNDIHIKDYTDYAKDMTKEELVDVIANFGVSLDYNEPAKRESLARKGIEWLKTTYNNIIATNNKVNIMSVRGEDLQIKETDKYDYILTYSFPCQDLSKAGTRKGMSDTSTRSGLLWEVDRILSELTELPQILLMENVPDVIGSRYISDFRIWEEKLRKLGYSNHIQILNAKDYGIPQNRERAFMVSILGDYLYNFPRKQELKLRLKDMLEESVDEKYYLSKHIINFFQEHTKKQQELGNGFKFEPRNKDDVAKTITTRNGSRPDDNFIEDIFISTDKRLPEMLDKIDYDSSEPQVLDLYNRSVHNISQTLTMPNHNAQAVVVLGNYSPSNHNATNIVSPNGISPIVMENHGSVTAIVVPDTKEFANYITWKDSKGRINTQDHRAYFEDRLSGTVPAMERGVPNVLKNDLRIRKLTPRECYRLMGFSDEAFYSAQPNQSNSSLYHQAGDSIVVNVLMGLFGELL